MSVPAKVNPHAMRSLWPASTPTNGGSPRPLRSSPAPPGARSSGAPASRCGGAGRWRGSAPWRALPLMTQLLLPSIVLHLGLQTCAARPGMSRGTPRRSRAAAARPARTGRRRPCAWRRAVVGEERHVEPLGHHELVPRIGRRRRFASSAPKRATFMASWISLIAWPRTLAPPARPAQHHRLGGPRIGLDAGELELDGRLSAFCSDEGVHPLAIRGEDRSALRVVAGPLRASNGPRYIIRRVRSSYGNAGAEDLGEPPSRQRRHISICQSRSCAIT
jgi:hypothetical protein